MLKINEERFLDMMRQQAVIGSTSEGGLSRPSLSKDDIAVREWFKGQIETHHLDYTMDGAGNQIASLRSDNPQAKTLLIGSHFDSVPNGGRYDGALGVIAAFEALLTIKDAEKVLPFHLQVINFTDEEGTLVGLLGSSALAGLLPQDSLKKPRGGRAVLLTGMEALGLTDDSFLAAKRNPDELLGYIEVHIEQGTRLEAAGLDIGVVTSIVGIHSLWMNFHGEAAHAGTKPMAKRKDAFWGAADFALKAREVIMRDFHPGVINFGEIQLEPGAFNIVPSSAQLAVEFRHGDANSLDAMDEVLLKLAQTSAKAYDLQLDVTRMHNIKPAPMSDSFVKAIEDAANTLHLSHKQLLSFAGHDAQSLAAISNAVMFFVPSVDGISHNPKEFTKNSDCINAANVMLYSILQIAEQQS
jgi:hydantoinase/carbamoylase family amidase